MRIRAVVSLGVVIACAAVAVPAGPSAEAAGAHCGSGTHGSSGYSYAGHQATRVAHGVQATIVALDTPRVSDGHVAAWVGVGGPNGGPGGTSQWLQAGIASLPGTAPLLYVEITRAGAEPVFKPIRFDVRPGERYRLGVSELVGRPGSWQVRVDGKAVTRPIRLPGSAGRWKPIATAESWNGGRAVCNRFAFRFEQVAVAGRPGGAWRQFVPGYRFLDRGFALRQLRPVGAGERVLSRDPVLPFAFEAATTA